MLAKSISGLYRRAEQLSQIVITRYLMASVAALAFDFLIFSILVATAMAPALASAIGYSAGIVVHWFISANFVFTGKTKTGKSLQIQRLMFVGTAVLGLAITVGIVGALTTFGVAPLLAKIAAAGASFVAVYLARKYGVFR